MEISLWLNAFIPHDAPGTIDGVGESAGVRVLRGPFPGVSDCFWTDNREFSTDLGASCRMQSFVRLESSSGSVIDERHRCGETVECDCEDGDIECRDTAGAKRMAFSSPLITRDGRLKIDVRGAAANACFAGSPDIDYVGSYLINFATRVISFSGLVNGFPAYESYCDVGGVVGTVFNFGPVGDPSDLFGEPSEPINIDVSF